MSKSIPVHISIEVQSENGETIEINSITVNHQVFVLQTEIEQKKGERLTPAALTVASLAMAPLLAVDQVNSVREFGSSADSIQPLAPGADFDTLEEFGAHSFFKMFWGSLTYQALDQSRTQVTFNGEGTGFDPSLVGKWLEPSRIHRGATQFPDRGRNYFPGAMTVVYSRVIEVLDPNNLIVDFAYNGGDSSNPKPISDQDGIFFFDNKFAIESWANSIRKKPVLNANSGQIYACLGIPKISISQDSSLRFGWSGTGQRPALQIMMSDAFNGNKHGLGEHGPASFRETFGENTSFFHLPGQGRVDLDFDWQYLPPIYSHRVVQYGTPEGTFFYDGATDSMQYGLKRVSNYDQFRIRDLMKASLGFLRSGISFSMPNQGYCNGGGIHDGKEITEFCTYRFEGDWFSKNPNNMKARTSGGLRVEWIGASADKPGNFIEMESLKPFRFENLNFKFKSNVAVEVENQDFTWYHLACQEMTGGTSTGSEATSLIVDGKTIGLNSNGDFWLLYGDEDVQARGLSGNRINLFDKIPSPGDMISHDPSDLHKNGLIGKVAPNRFEVWGWAVLKDDLLSFEGKSYTVKSAQRKWKTWEQFSEQYASPERRLLRSDRRITYTEIELDQAINADFDHVHFEVVKGSLAHLLDGKEVGGCTAFWSFGNDSPGHLMYTDYNVNLVMKNVQIHGLIRSTSRPIWANTTTALTGSISRIPINGLGASMWKTGDRIQLAHPESGIAQEVELILSYGGNGSVILIKPIQLLHDFPVDSIVTAFHCLPSEARFENVNFVKEDLSPSYSQRIDYRPQGLRLRQLLSNNDAYRVKIIGGRISWYSNADNRFEPEIELSGRPHLVNPTSVVPILINPVILDGKGAWFGYQYKQTGEEELFLLQRILVRGNAKLDLSNSVLGADLYIEGNGTVVLDKLLSKKFKENGVEKGFGFNLVVEDKFQNTEDLKLEGENGAVGLMINKAYPIGVLKIDFKNWKLSPSLFNAAGFQTKQESSDPNYKIYIRISD
jgi:hypothetical protein